MSDESPKKKVVDREYLTVMGRVDATPKFVSVLLRTYWLVRLIYNAVIDSRIGFEAGVEYRLAESKAKFEGIDPPESADAVG